MRKPILPRTLRVHGDRAGPAFGNPDLRFDDRGKTERVSVANRNTQLDVGHVIAAPNVRTCRMRLPQERNDRDGACPQAFGICQSDLRRARAEVMAARRDDVETIESLCRHRLGRSTWSRQYAERDRQSKRQAIPWRMLHAVRSPDCNETIAGMRRILVGAC